MNKAWVVFGLVLLLGIQVTVLSSFHEVYADGPAYGTTEVCIVKWNYVQASARVAIGGPGSVSVTLPNGTDIAINATTNYSFTLNLPRTGAFSGETGLGVGSIELNESSPITVSIDANITSVPFSNSCSEIVGVQYVDVAVITVVGDAFVSVDVYGVGL